MSRDSDDHSQEAERARLQALRRALEAGEYPPGLEELYRMLAPPERPDRAPGVGGADDAEDEVMLAMLISEALDGVDIARRYPHFFKRLMQDAELRAAFLDGLEVLESAEDVPREILPLPPSRDLSFLKKARRTSPAVVEDPSRGWTMRWRRSAQEIAGLFSFLTPGRIAEGYRSGGYLEDETVTLLRGRLTSRTLELDVTLEGTRPASQPDELQLTLWVLPVEESAVLDRDLALVATVSWGAYEAQVEITRDGRYTLPPRKIESLAEDAQKATGDLHITLQDKR